jgi:hypothetical protein
MAEHIFTILCESASVDSLSNGLSLTKIIEEIAVSPIPQEPGLSPVAWTLVTLAARTDRETPETPRMRITLVFPDGSELQGPSVILDLKTAPRARQLAQIQGLMIKGIGDYAFVTDFEDAAGNWIRCGKWVFRVGAMAAEPT